MWRLSLPAGATRDHPGREPIRAGGAGGPAEVPPPLVAAGDRDIREYVARVQATGNNKRVDLVEFPGAGHGFAIFEPDSKAAGELVRVVRRFVHGGDAALRMSGSALGLGDGESLGPGARAGLLVQNASRDAATLLAGPVQPLSPCHIFCLVQCA